MEQGATQLKREGEPDDIARAVHFLLAEATYVTGETINVDNRRGHTDTPRP